MDKKRGSLTVDEAADILGAEKKPLPDKAKPAVGIFRLLVPNSDGYDWDNKPETD